MKGDGGEVPMARPVALQRNSSGELLDLTVFLRDEAGRVSSDWLLVPGEAFGPKRDYLYVGDRLVLQLERSDGDSPVRSRVVVTDDGIGWEVTMTGSMPGLWGRGCVEGS